MKIKYLPVACVILAIILGLAISEVWAVVELKQSTAVTLKFGPMVDATNGVTPETALTAHAAHIELAKNGGNIAPKNDATVPAHDEDGYWDITLNATDTGTLGVLRVMWTDSNAAPAWQDFAIVDANYWNVKYSTEITKADVRQWSGNAVPEPNNAGVPHVDTIYIDGAATPVLTKKVVSDGSAAPTNFGAMNITASGNVGIDWANVENPTTAVDLSATDIQLADTVTTLTGHTAQTGDSFARIGVAGAGLTNIDLPNQTMDITGNITGDLVGTVSTVTTLTGHTAQTGDSFARIGVAGAGLTNIDLPNQTMDITGSLSGSVGSVTGAVGSVTGNVGGNVTGSVGSLVGHTVQTGDSFARIGATGSGLTSLAPAATALTNATWTDAKAAFLDAAISGIAAGTVPGAVTGTVATASNTRQFTLSADFKAGLSAHKGQWITITDADDSNVETRRIDDYQASRVVQVNEPFSFTPANADVAVVWGYAYSKGKR